MNGITYIENFIPNSQTLFNDFLHNIDSDKRMKAFRFWIGRFNVHSDQTDILAENKGIATITFGETAA